MVDQKYTFRHFSRPAEDNFAGPGGVEAGKIGRIMKTFLQRRDPWGHGVPLWLIAGVVFLLPIMGWSLSHIDMENDVAGWLPKDDPQSIVLEWYQRHFPTEDRVLVSWNDCTLTDPRMAQLVRELSGVDNNGRREGGSPYISEVRQPADLLKRMMKEGVPFETALQRTQGLLIGDGPLCIRLTDAGRLRGEYLRKEILQLANGKHGLQAEWVQQALPMPTTEGLALEDEASFKLHDALTEYIRSRPLYDWQLSWPRMHIDRDRSQAFRDDLLQLQTVDQPQAEAARNCIEDSFFISGSMAAVTVALSEAGTADHRQALQAIREAAVKAGIPEQALHLGGRPVAGSALNQAVKHAAWNRDFPLWQLPQRSPILLSGLVTLAFTVLVLRSLRLTLLVQSVALLCALAAVALVPATGGSMNMVLVVMPTLLFVLTVSGAIHVCNYWRASGCDHPADSVHQATAIAWLPCAMASGTTAIGFASLMTGSLIPVRDFGIYAAIGCVISFVCVVYVLPSLMLYWPQRPPRPESMDTGIWRFMGQQLGRWHTAVNLLCLVAAVACAWGLREFRTETKVIRYFPDDSQVAQDYYFLEENLSGIVSVDTIVRFDKAAQQQLSFMDRARRVMQIQEALREHPEVSGTLSLASFLDLTEQDTSQMTRMQRMQVKRRESAIEERIHERLAAGDSEGNGLSSMLALADTASDWHVQGDAALNAAGDELWRITCQSSIMSDYDYAVLTHELDQITRHHLSEVGSPGTGHIVTGLIPIFLRTQQALLESLISSFGMAFVVIGLVMAVTLRSVLAASLAMLPNILPVVTMFGLLAWSGIRVDIGTMITASVALGIAVDGTLHLITWFRLLLQRGVPRHEAVVQALEHCGPALWQTSAAIGLGMLALLPVELLLISRFGWIMAGMIFVALLGDVILLPALLAGPLGVVLERGLKRRSSTLSRTVSLPTTASPAAAETAGTPVVPVPATHSPAASAAGPTAHAGAHASSSAPGPAQPLPAHGRTSGPLTGRPHFSAPHPLQPQSATDRHRAG